MLANKFSSRRDENIYRKPQKDDVTFEIIIDDDNLKLGEDVDIKMFIKNNSTKEKTIKASIVTKVAFYTGVVAKDLETLREEIKLNSKEGRYLFLFYTCVGHCVILHKRIPQDKAPEGRLRSLVIKTAPRLSTAIHIPTTFHCWT